MGERSPTGRLREEHASALAQIREMEAAVKATAGGGHGKWGEAAGEIGERVEKLRAGLLVHFRQEEEALYPDVREMVGKGAPRVDILGQFFEETADDDLTAHHILRNWVREMVEMAAAVGEGWTVGDLETLVRESRDLLTRHVKKEDTLVFPMVERLLSPEQMAAAGRRMAAIRGEG